MSLLALPFRPPLTPFLSLRRTSAWYSCGACRVLWALLVGVGARITSGLLLSLAWMSGLASRSAGASPSAGGGGNARGARSVQAQRGTWTRQPT